MDSSNIPGFTAENSLERNDRPYLLYRSHLTSESVIPQFYHCTTYSSGRKTCACNGLFNCLEMLFKGEAIGKCKCDENGCLCSKPPPKK